MKYFEIVLRGFRSLCVKEGIQKLQFEATARYSDVGENSMSLVRVLTMRAITFLSVLVS